jgi:predicted TIM-barrel fold metal-dependent hydrolase
VEPSAPSVVIDAHTHAFPADWVSDRGHLLRRDKWFAALYEAPLSRMVDAGGLLRAMDATGVAQAVMCGWPWMDQGLCRDHNDYLAEAAAGSGGRLAWLGIVAPTQPGAEAEVGRCLDLGASGIGELNADAQGFDLRRPEMIAGVTAMLAAAGRPALLHASEPHGHLYPGKGTATPDHMLVFLEANPELPVVLAHWGGGLPFFELMPEIAKITANVAYDTAASAYLYRPQIFRTVLDVVGPKRVMWASDHPVLGMKRFLALTSEEAGIRPDEWDAVMAGNARRVYGLAEITRDRVGLTP